jgi:hypothetical protein
MISWLDVSLSLAFVRSLSCKLGTRRWIGL